MAFVATVVSSTGVLFNLVKILHIVVVLCVCSCVFKNILVKISCRFHLKGRPLEVNHLF